MQERHGHAHHHRDCSSPNSPMPVGACLSGPMPVRVYGYSHSWCETKRLAQHLSCPFRSGSSRLQHSHLACHDAHTARRTSPLPGQGSCSTLLSALHSSCGSDQKAGAACLLWYRGTRLSHLNRWGQGRDQDLGPNIV